MDNQKVDNQCLGFAPIVSPNPNMVILGTMPSVKSLEHAFYYAHPQNQFWPIMSSITGHAIETVEHKRQLIELSGIILWDVLQACERKGSLDSAIQKPIANDFSSLFNQFDSIQYVVFNGKKAEQLFKQHVIKKQSIPTNLIFVSLPSTSPANATMKKQDKQLFWQEKLSDLL